MKHGIALVLVSLSILGLWKLAQLVLRHQFGSIMDPAYRQGSMGEVSIQVENADLVHRAQGVRQWAFHCDKIQVLTQPYSDLERYRAAEFMGIRHGVWYKQGNPQATFSAGRAEYDEPQRLFTIREKIRVETREKERLDAPLCAWSEKDDFVRFPEGARAESKRGWVEAPTAVFQPEQRVLQCVAGGAGEIDKQPFTTSTLIWDMKRDIMRLPGSTALRRKGANFDVHDAELDLKNHQLRANRGRVTLRIDDQDPDLEGEP